MFYFSILCLLLGASSRQTHTQFFMSDTEESQNKTKLFTLTDSKGNTHSAYIEDLNKTPQKCIFYSLNNSEMSWTNTIPTTQEKAYSFHIKNPNLGPTKEFYSKSFFKELFPNFSDNQPPINNYFTQNYDKVSPIISVLATNSSLLSSSFNMPLREDQPGYYIWWLYPQQIKLAWTENSNEVRISWVTYVNFKPKFAYKQLFCDELTGFNDWQFPDVNTQDFDEGNINQRYQTVHTVHIKKLKEKCIYEYVVGSSCFWSEVYSFNGRTPFYNKSTTELEGNPADLIIIGDWGNGVLGSYTNYLLQNEMQSRHIDGIIHMGDLAYDLPTNDGRVGDDWFNMIQPIAARIPYMCIPGNHEAFNNMSHFTNRLRMPVTPENQGTNLFYSFNLGPAHFTLINTEAYFDESLYPGIETHDNWLIKDLEQANLNREKVPWIFVFNHRALYCSDEKKDCYHLTLIIRDHIEEILNKNSVDIMFQAHVHNYERCTPIYNNTKIVGDYDTFNYYYSPKAPIYVVNGNAGNFQAHNDPFKSNKDDWHMFGSEDYGYGRLKVYNKTHVYYEQFSSEKGTEIDYFWVIKNNS
ncbi:hypothetical protein SteCoe_15198 [Stentor coeruleus]|uniref:Purple acid phosphatase n=1 Tax=Stentor coeruleus TaxID=5963 RepID=A0A1R2C486_9CILI|nr:hypothetical protein SteCoe_15198 [Stentor coeruleus]